MRIAQISPLCESVPPSLYGGTERIVAHLCDALVELGHDVTLFACADSVTRARLIPVRERPIRLDPSPLKSELAAHLSMLAEVRERVEDFGILHFHIDLLHMPWFTDVAQRSLTTLHGRLDMTDLARAYHLWPHYPLVSISDQQRKPVPFANWLGTVHHGLSPKSYTFNPNQGGYLAFLGRLSPEKRPDRAIAIAKKSGIPLKIAAKIDAADKEYFEASIRPQLDHPLVEFIGEIGDHEKSDFLGNAAALLFPIDWPEPFGLVMIEAMACGTPVIAFRCGSVPEVVDDEVTGFIVETVDDAVAAVDHLGMLDRRRIRAIFERRFSATAMAKNYVELYQRLLQGDAGTAPYAPDGFEPETPYTELARARRHRLEPLRGMGT